jgi:hypothetical protein
MHYATSHTTYKVEPESFAVPVYNMERKIVPRPPPKEPKPIPVTKEEYEAQLKATMDRYTKRMKELANNKRGIKVVGK